MRALLVVCATLVAGCQPKAEPAVAPQPSQTIAIPGTNGGTPMTMTISRTTSPAVRVVAGSADAVWRALPTVYSVLSIPIEERNVAARTLGNPALKLRRRLGDVPLSRYLDCGSAQGGPSADTYDVLLSVETRVQAVGADSAMVTTVVDGRGRPVAFSADYVNCGSRGALEKRFFEVLGVQLRP